MIETKVTRTRLQKRTRRNASLIALTAAMLSHQIRPSDCFGGVKYATRPRAKRISVDFSSATEEHISSVSPTSAFFYGDSFTNDILLSKHQEAQPTWLSIDRSKESEKSMNALTSFMKESFFTETETLKMATVIGEASDGNTNAAAGAAEFCLLLAETMEMGLNALTAAAIHYCSCVRSGENKIGIMAAATTNLSSYGPHVKDIVNDAARLKQLEMVAGAVMKEHGGRASPDKQDAENLRCLLMTETKDWRALAIRSAACLFRLRCILGAKSNELTKEAVRTSREALGIYAPLASRLGMHRLKNELEGTAFRILYRRQYEAVQSMHQRRNGKEENHIGEAMHRVLNTVKDEMKDILDADDEFVKQVDDFEVSARVKEPYSMWKKMLKNKYDHVLQVPDALALRIVLKAKKLTPDEPAAVTHARERALCYYAQKLCLARWKPLSPDPRFKDYIAHPKENGYQSLHYTAETNSEGQAWTLEVQVRSAKMHHVAEFGLASHWDYKAAQKKKSKTVRVTMPDADRSSDAYLRNVQDWEWKQHAGKVGATPASFEPVVLSDIWQSRERADRIRARTERLEPYLQALTNKQSDLAREQVFVFVTDSGDGQVLALPSGACVLDALRHEEQSFGIALVNGKDASVTRRLRNGDILELAKSKATA